VTAGDYYVETPPRFNEGPGRKKARGRSPGPGQDRREGRPLYSQANAEVSATGAKVVPWGLKYCRV
jgi:hypothetical protein